MIPTFCLIARFTAGIPNNLSNKFMWTKATLENPTATFGLSRILLTGIMRKGSTTAKLTEYEIECNKSISKFRYIVEQDFGISHLHDEAKRARFTTTAKNRFDVWYRQVYPR